MSESGLVCGFYMQCEIPVLDDSFFWSGSGPLTVLQRPAGVSSAAAGAVNDRGQVVGVHTIAGVGNRAFLWEDGVWTNLGVLPGGTRSEAFAINAHGQIVGEWHNGVPGQNPRAAL